MLLRCKCLPRGLCVLGKLLIVLGRFGASTSRLRSWFTTVSCRLRKGSVSSRPSSQRGWGPRGPSRSTGRYRSSLRVRRQWRGLHLSHWPSSRSGRWTWAGGCRLLASLWHSCQGRRHTRLRDGLAPTSIRLASTASIVLAGRFFPSLECFGCRSILSFRHSLQPYRSRRVQPKEVRVRFRDRYDLFIATGCSALARTPTWHRSVQYVEVDLRCIRFGSHAWSQLLK